MAFVEPVAARYRTTLVLNLGAMALAVVLGSLAVRAVAQRARLEGQAREDACPLPDRGLRSLQPHEPRHPRAVREHAQFGTIIMAATPARQIQFVRRYVF